MGRSPSAPQTYNKNLSACRTTTEHLLNDGRGPQTSKKSSQSHQNEVGQKIKIKKKKKKDNRFQEGDLNPQKVVVKQEKFPHTWKPAHRWGQGSLGISEESIATGDLKANWRELMTEIICEGHFPAMKQLARLQQVVAWSSGSCFGGQISGRGLGLTAVMIL